MTKKFKQRYGQNRTVELHAMFLRKCHIEDFGGRLARHFAVAGRLFGGGASHQRRGGAGVLGAPTSLLSVMGLQAIPYSKAASNWHATKALLAPPILSLYGVGNNNILGHAR